MERLFSGVYMTVRWPEKWTNRKNRRHHQHDFKNGENDENSHSSILRPFIILNEKCAK
jgi:hypothetical protein